MPLKFSALPLKIPSLGKLPNLPSLGKPLGLPFSKSRPLSSVNRRNQATEDQAQYDYVQRMQKIKAVGEQPKAQPKADANTISVGGMGKSFCDKGTYGFQRQFDKFMRVHKTSFQNLSQEEKKGLHDMIVGRVRQKGIGSGFTERDRKIMRMQAYKTYKSGKISSEDLKDYKNVINKLQS